MPTAEAEVAAVVDAYTAVVDRLRSALVRVVTASWSNLRNYRSDDIAGWVRATVPLVSGAQFQVASLTDAYLAQVETIATGTPVRPLGVARSVVTDLRGVPGTEVYTRPGKTVWTALSNGRTMTEAVTEGLDRATSIALTDVQLAKTHSAAHVFRSRSTVMGYRRVLEGAKDCGLCIVASTRRYRKGDLMPIHPGCDCGILPIFGDSEVDPDDVVLDPELLAETHAAIADRFGASTADARGGGKVPDYRDVLVTRQHGELGPVLTVRGQKFTGPDDL